MKRSVCPVPRKWRAIGSTLDSLRPRRTTMFTLIGVRPAASAAAMPSSTRSTGKSTSFMRLNVSSSSESRLTVTRFKPAAASAFAFAASSEPFVVSVRSRSAIGAISSTNLSTSRRTSGSPPVSRTFRVPNPTKIPTSRAISSNVSTWSCGRNA